MRSQWLVIAVCLAQCMSNLVCSEAKEDFVIVVGAPGEVEYETLFLSWSDRWQVAAEKRGANVHQLGSVRAEESEETPSDRQLLSDLLTQTKSEPNDDALWLIFIGHGTFQQGIANFNLRGPDLSAVALAEILSESSRPLVIINCSSSSGPFIKGLSGDQRIVITATRAGDEQNFSRYGDYLSQAIGDTAADLDHDDQVSILEAYLKAASDTANYYKQEGRIVTEHPLLDDNGDGLGTPPDFFRGIHRIADAKSGGDPDGEWAARRIVSNANNVKEISSEQQARREELVNEIALLRKAKSDMDVDEYFDSLERVMLELARIENPPE